MSNAPGPSSAPKPAPAIQALIQDLLERRGIPERQRLGELESALGLEYTQVRRRMRGETPFTTDEAARLASYFQVPLLLLLGALVEPEAGRLATLQQGGVAQPCTVWLGRKRRAAGFAGPFVAYERDGLGQWVVVAPAEAGDRTVHEVRRLVWDALPARRVAVVDDDANLTESIVDYLRAKGMDAVPFQSIDKIRAAMQHGNFDGYVLDWLLDKTTVRELLAEIRAKDSKAAIVVLTGQTQDGSVQEEDLAAAVATFRAQLFLKPSPNVSLYTALTVGFEPSVR